MMIEQLGEMAIQTALSVSHEKMGEYIIWMGFLIITAPLLYFTVVIFAERWDELREDESSE